MKLDLKLRGIKKYYLNQKGITLIALVVTIVVLLILAGVSINALFGNNGIISRAKDTKKVTNLSSLKDEIGIVIQSRNINKMAGLPVGNFKEELENGISGNKTVEAIGNIGDTCYVTREEATVTVYDNGDIIDGKADIWDGTSKSKPTADESKNWHIYTPEEMKYFEEFVNGKLTDEEKEGLEITDSTIIYLENDIDMGARQENGVLTAGTAWNPIGVDSAGKFTGTFEGNNHTVKGIYVKKDGNFAGLFGNSDTIQNLTIADSYIEATGGGVGGIVGALREGSIINCNNVRTNVVGTGEGTNRGNIGGIVGQFTGEQIDNCENTGNVKAADGKLCVGGIVGNLIAANNTVTNCTNIGNVQSNGYSIGGIGGRITGKKIENCINKGEISGGTENSYGQLGGIVGISGTETIINCQNIGNIMSNGKNNGGIVGTETKVAGNILNCKNVGNITSKSNRNGGIIGQAAGGVKIKQCINIGKINGTEENGGIAGGIAGTTMEQCYNIGEIRGIKKIGGICGATLNMDESIIKNCYNVGDIIPEKTLESESEIQYLGGIIGWISSNQTSGTISNNYNIGKIETEGKNATYVGGVIGLLSNTYTIKNNYYITGISTTSEELAVAGESKTEAEMKTEEFLALLNVDQETPVWELKPSKNNGYPSLIGVD